MPVLVKNQAFKYQCQGYYIIQSTQNIPLILKELSGKPNCETLAIKQKEYSKKIEEILRDRPRGGTPAEFTPEQIVSIVAIACEVIDDSQRHSSRWTLKEIADEAVNPSF